MCNLRLSSDHIKVKRKRGRNSLYIFYLTWYIKNSTISKVSNIKNLVRFYLLFLNRVFEIWKVTTHLSLDYPICFGSTGTAAGGQCGGQCRPTQDLSIYLKSLKSQARKAFTVLKTIHRGNQGNECLPSTYCANPYSLSSVNPYHGP